MGASKDIDDEDFSNILNTINNLSVSGITIDPLMVITVVLDADPPNDWAPEGFSSDTQLIIIKGDSSKITINTIDRITPNNKVLFFQNLKDGDKEIKFKKNGTGLANNRIFGGKKDPKVYSKGVMGFLSSDETGGWSVIGGKVS